MNSIETRIIPELFVRCTEGGGFQQVEISIDREPLIEIVKQVEYPYATQEFDKRIGAGESSDNLVSRSSLAGDYLYLSPKLTFLPSQNFFGEPYKHGFLTQKSNLVNQKSLILQCTCGIIDCWFLLAKITIKCDTVVWSDFQQFHRDWEYDLDPFVFDRKQYELMFAMP